VPGYAAYIAGAARGSPIVAGAVGKNNRRAPTGNRWGSTDSHVHGIAQAYRTHLRGRVAAGGRTTDHHHQFNIVAPGIGKQTGRIGAREGGINRGSSRRMVNSPVVSAKIARGRTVGGVKKERFGNTAGVSRNQETGVRAINLHSGGYLLGGMAALGIGYGNGSRISSARIVFHHRVLRGRIGTGLENAAGTYPAIGTPAGCTIGYNQRRRASGSTTGNAGGNAGRCIHGYRNVI